MRSTISTATRGGALRDCERRLLREIRDELRGLRADLAGCSTSTSPPALRKEQIEALETIIPVLAGVFGAARFSCWEAIDIAGQKTAEGANVRIALSGRNAQQLGKLLQLGLGRDFDGVRVIRAGQDASGKRWQCVGNGLP